MEERLCNEGQYYVNINKVRDPDSIYVLVDKFNQLDEEYVPYDLEMIHEEFNPMRLLLRREARIAFEEMCCVAKQQGILLEAVSAFRSYSYQSTVYMKNWTEGIPLEEYRRQRDQVSARPGHSEHQTGLAVDINDLEETFADTPAGRWLACNAHYFGFILRYPKGKEAITGYSYEPWHFRYVGRYLAEKIYRSGMTYDEYYYAVLNC
ncbi:MAG TPA: M15 family metallopeptidase [Clostridiales bacterium]|nr:M15 family metallopeptidase [Clostridiales bacterium]